jgi:hypothetical protein
MRAMKEVSQVLHLCFVDQDLGIGWCHRRRRHLHLLLVKSANYL